MITAKQAQTLTKLSIAKQALENAIESYDENIVKGAYTGYTIGEFFKEVSKYKKNIKWSEKVNANDVLSMDDIVNLCYQAFSNTSEKAVLSADTVNAIEKIANDKISEIINEINNVILGAE